MKRPILILVLGYITGIMLGLYCKISIAFFYPFIILILLAIKKIIKRRKNLKRYYTLMIQRKFIVLFIIISIISNTIVISLNKDYETIYQLDCKERFYGIVISNSIKKDYYTQYKVKISNCAKSILKNKVIYLNIKKDIDLEYGERISFYGEYEPPEGKRNYKGFSYKNYLKTINICGIIHTEVVNKEGRAKSNPIIKFISKLRKKLVDIFQEKIQDKEKRNLLLGILIGYDDELLAQTKEIFSDSGLSHILAVSGMHVSCICMGITYVLKKLNLSKRIISKISVIFLIFFIFLIEGTPSVQRACIMTILVLMASLLHRKSDTINNLTISLLILIIENPFNILNIGLILSYGATLGIIVTNSIIKNKEEISDVKFNNQPIKKEDLKRKILNKLLINIKSIIKISLSVQIFILPIIILTYNKISLTFLISNLIISLVISMILILGYISIVLQFKIIYISLNILLGYVIEVSKFIASIPISKILVTTPNMLSVIIYYILLIFIIYIKYLKNKRYKRRIEKRLLTNVDNLKTLTFKKIKEIIFLIIIIGLIIQIIQLNNSELKIHFIDVGQGDASLIITPKGKTVLIDGGGSIKKEGYDVGKKTLLPYLLARKVKTLDYVMISHFDSDHVRFYPISITGDKSEKCYHRKAI